MPKFTIWEDVCLRVVHSIDAENVEEAKKIVRSSGAEAWDSIDCFHSGKIIVVMEGEQILEGEEDPE